MYDGMNDDQADAVRARGFRGDAGERQIANDERQRRLDVIRQEQREAARDILLEYDAGDLDDDEALDALERIWTKRT